MTSVWSDREIIDALDSDGPHTDIILAEVTLLMADGAQMLRYIMHHKHLRHIPVISKPIFLFVLMYNSTEQTLHKQISWKLTEKTSFLLFWIILSFINKRSGIYYHKWFETWGS